MKKPSHLVRGILGTLAISVVLTGVTIGKDRDVGTKAPDMDAHFETWRSSLEKIQSLVDPAQVFEPYVYYVDELGPYFFDHEYNLIHLGASLTPSELYGAASTTAKVTDDCDEEEAIVCPGNGGSTGNGGNSGGPSCWVYRFEQNGGFYPNPAGSESNRSADVDLVVLDTDGGLNSATLSSRVYNSLGQTVYTNTIGTFASAPTRIVTVWNGKNNSGQSVASGVYTIRVTASSSLCGNKAFAANVVIVN